jgi:hypothetical protein
MSIVLTPVSFKWNVLTSIGTGMAAQNYITLPNVNKAAFPPSNSLTLSLVP